MKLKLDENLSKEAANLLSQAGHDVSSVVSENICGTKDEILAEFCQKEARCLVTLDLEFGNPLIFKPSEYSGIVVLRLPHRSSHEDLLATIRTLIAGLRREKDISGKLWIVQRQRIREYQPEDYVE